MKTDDLIRTLAADAPARERAVGHSLLAALMVAMPVSAALFLAELGVRRDFMAALANPFFDLKFAVTLALAAAALVLSLHLSRPEVSPARWMWLLALPAGLIGIGIAGDVMVPQRASWTARLVGTNARVCVLAIPALSLPLLVAMLAALRRGAPSRPVLAGACAGLAAAGLGATLYAAHCTDDSPLFVATWYTLAAALVAALGAAAGHRLLRY